MNKELVNEAYIKLVKSILYQFSLIGDDDRFTNEERILVSHNALSDAFAVLLSKIEPITSDVREKMLDTFIKRVVKHEQHVRQGRGDVNTTKN
jgi:hypothetical protein